jgi:oxygen-independent coproporphyrinogen-3 oxidase
VFALERGHQETSNRLVGKGVTVQSEDLSIRLQDLIDKGSIPPFVYCYPPRSAYRALPPEQTRHAIWNRDYDVSLTHDLNLYIHVPFCRYKCGFCNLYTVINTDSDQYDRYVDAICNEIRLHEEIIVQRNIRTVYIGGGTPSLLSVRHFEQIFATITSIYPNWRASVEEVCIEATPDSIVDSPSRVSELMHQGLTRINMGVQSLEEAELKEAGRSKANPNVVAQATAIVKERSLPNLSTDLIMGFHGQTAASWERSVRRLVELDPETISTYFLTVRPDAWFSKTGRYAYQRSPELYERYDVARDIIREHGYVQESNVRYKKMGRGGYRQKVLQFHGVPVLGIGAGARTYTNTVDYIFGGSARPHISQVEQYIDCVSRRELPITAGFDFDDSERIRKRIALDLFDLDFRDLTPYSLQSYESEIAPLVNACVEQELAIQVGPSRLQLTPKGYKYRDIISWLAFSRQVVDRDRQFYEVLHAKNTRAVERMGATVSVSGVSTKSSGSRIAIGPVRSS